MKIEFEAHSFAVDEWWSGEITLDIGDELGILFTNEMEDKLHNYYSQL